ncbi:hypothetical protein CLAFUW4_07465 [Fulvia fulva]|uniref:Uncharacterized protein n=1 Tax=Passalora fulva TaxID=5499 RepID=A0A9Q8PBG9_PASFU|nr:uncharacterized protein CLAFUR5_07595 [Fulvia fulva]UJO19365.1 hypothetical protein CLAFUR5_07595 [Fulvia fulva]WPV16672.1 hypothetical protein CLAFUW4_07465 [Fulvia fulva]WPV31598.1 hypothetical protein CLAFUW7_07467 [Fulvia fulva]
MGIDRLYYWTAALGLASFCCLSTWGPFDGKFHRPKNQYVKQRKKSNVAASAAAEKAEKLASEVGLDGVADRASAKKRKYERGARDERDDEPAARPSTKQDRRRSRAQTPGPARRHKHGHGDDTTVFHSSTYDSSDSSRSSEKRASQQRSSRVKPTPYSGYVPEASAHHSSQSTPSTATRPTKSLLTSPSQITRPAKRTEMVTMRPTNTSMEDMMTRCTPPSKAPHEEHTDDDSSAGPDDSPLKHSPAKRKLGNLHKRRVSASPEKFNKGHFEPLSVRTDLPVPSRGSEPKKSRTEDRKIEVYYDANGTPRIRAAPTSISAGLTPQSTTFSPYLTSAALQPGTPPTSSVPSGSLSVANRLLAGQSGRVASRKPQDKNFSLLEAFVKDNALCILLVSYLPMPALISLYAISKTLHHSFNKHATAFVLSSTRTWAPNADQIYPWRCYKPLCIKDPIKRQKASAEAQGAAIDMLRGTSRDVPSIRWLQMVTWREGVVRDMIIQLTSQALRVPTDALDAMKRMWFILDLPLNAHRLALICNKDYISDKVLYHATHMFLKIDMAFTDPGMEPFSAADLALNRYPQEWLLGQPIGSALREHLLMERSLTPLWRALRGWNWNPDEPMQPMTDDDIIQLWLRRKAMVPSDAPDAVKKLLVLGDKVGSLPKVGYERVYQPENDPNLSPEEKARAIAALPPPASRYRPRPLLTPDDLIMRECVRRQLRQHEWWISQMLWGFVYPGGRLIRTRTREQLTAIQRSNHFNRVTTIPTNEDGEEVKPKDAIPPPPSESAQAGPSMQKEKRQNAVGNSEQLPETPKTAGMFAASTSQL